MNIRTDAVDENSAKARLIREFYDCVDGFMHQISRAEGSTIDPLGLAELRRFIDQARTEFGVEFSEAMQFATVYQVFLASKKA